MVGGIQRELDASMYLLFHRKENASHHCEVSAWLAGLTSLLAPTHDGNEQFMVYHAGDSNQPLSCDIRLLLEGRLESVPFRGKIFVSPVYRRGDFLSP